jgi:hypothetical protein
LTAVVLIDLLSFDDLREAVEALQPRADALEGDLVLRGGAWRAPS